MRKGGGPAAVHQRLCCLWGTWDNQSISRLTSWWPGDLLRTWTHVASCAWLKHHEGGSGGAWDAFPSHQEKFKDLWIIKSCKLQAWLQTKSLAGYCSQETVSWGFSRAHGFKGWFLPGEIGIRRRTHTHRWNFTCFSFFLIARCVSYLLLTSCRSTPIFVWSLRGLFHLQTIIAWYLSPMLALLVSSCIHFPPVLKYWRDKVSIDLSDMQTWEPSSNAWSGRRVSYNDIFNTNQSFQHHRTIPECLQSKDFKTLSVREHRAHLRREKVWEKWGEMLVLICCRAWPWGPPHPLKTRDCEILGMAETHCGGDKQFLEKKHGLSLLKERVLKQQQLQKNDKGKQK